MSFNDSKLIESKNATISASSKTGVCEDSRTSLGGLARAATQHTFHRPANCRWSVGGAFAIGAEFPGRNTAPTSRPSRGRPKERTRRAYLGAGYRRRSGYWSPVWLLKLF